MRRTFIVAGCLALPWVLCVPAVADGGGDGETTVNGAASGYGIGGDNSATLTGEEEPSQPSPVINAVEPTVTENELAEQFCTGTNWSLDCVPAEVPPSEPTVQWGEEAFKLVVLPESRLIIQPPNGRTLVNFDTNFYTDAPTEIPYSVPILDRVVELRVWPAQFTWEFGDGSSVQTTDRGAPYPDLDITHRYLRKGPVRARVDTTYAAQWRVQGQTVWQPVQDTVTIEGTSAELAVLTATPTLVG